MKTIFSPEDFQSQQPPERIIGVETEYTTADEVCREEFLRGGLTSLKYKTAHTNGEPGIFISNGAKVYVAGKLVEYAGPESRGPRQAAAADHAGMIVICNLNNKLAENEVITADQASAVYRVTGSFDPTTSTIKTTGYHQNFLTIFDRNPEQQKNLRKLVSSYLATSMIWDGSGMVANKFFLSQKEPSIGTEVVDGHGHRTAATHKPMASFYHSKSYAGLADDKIPSGWSMIEVRFADAHMNRTSTFLSLGAMSLLLRLLEQGVVNTSNIDEFTLKDTLETKERVSRSVGNCRVETNDGQTMTAAEYQQKLATAEAELANDDQVLLPADERLASLMMVNLTDKLVATDHRKPEDLAALPSSIEWALKYRYISSKLGGNILSNSNICQAISIDREWHNASTRVKNAKAGKTMASLDPMYNDMEAEVQRLISSAPYTRAHARATIVSAGICEDLKWNIINLGNNKFIELPDPYDSLALNEPKIADQEQELQLV